jgi:hypothetical protein
MPYKSDAQRRYFHANEAKLKAQGVSVAEYDRASKGKELPETAAKADGVGGGNARVAGKRKPWPIRPRKPAK